MVENTVVKEQITDDMIDAGARLTAKLDELGLPLAAAMWFFLPDINEWRLLFASGAMSSAGPRFVYEKIQRARQLLGDEAAAVPLSAVGLIDANDQLVQRLRMGLQTSSGVSPIRISRTAINGHFIEDALVYRIV